MKKVQLKEAVLFAFIEKRKISHNLQEQAKFFSWNWIIPVYHEVFCLLCIVQLFLYYLWTCEKWLIQFHRKNFLHLPHTRSGCETVLRNEEKFVKKNRPGNRKTTHTHIPYCTIFFICRPQCRALWLTNPVGPKNLDQFGNSSGRSHQ